MPDLQTALSKVINEWESPTQLSPTPAPAAPPDTQAKHLFQPSNNVTRATFNFVRDNAGMTRASVVKHLAAKGYKTASTTSLLTQMLRQGMIKEANKGLFVNQPEYTPIRPSALRDAPPRRQPKKKPAPAPHLSLDEQKALLLAARPPEPAPLTKSEWSVHEVLKGLSVLQARELYDELRKIFKE